MLFNSFEFLIFLPVVFCLYWFLFKKKLVLQNALILLASYFFYGWWSWQFMGLLMLSTILDYTYGFWVASSNREKAKLFLWLSVINNLGILAIFKYYNFFASQFQQGFDSLGLHFDVYLLQIALPVGISFYTFHGMSYVFDIYRSQQKPVKNFIDYAVFVSFFPLLVAGPIERANHLLPQVQKPRKFNYAQSVEGLRLILWGLFKKVVVADSIAVIINPVFQDSNSYDSFSIIAAAIGFSIQIYGDFSGYSDIALGTAKLFGFELLSNFKFPYFSRSVAEFWKRWHISLSSWFRDYLYIPLGGSKEGRFKTIRNTFIIFLVSGFWHGANWTFITWGFIHAVGFMPLLLLKRTKMPSAKFNIENIPTAKEVFQILYTFSFVTIAWVFFRSETIQQALFFFKDFYKNVGEKSIIHNLNFTILIPVILLFIMDWKFRKNERQLAFFKHQLLNWLAYITLGLVIIFYFLNNQAESSFIYFQF
jgi:D-alanyl-lipoteichoic acid acyltransferase DltB (MBOAT superfamily)